MSDATPATGPTATAGAELQVPAGAGGTTAPSPSASTDGTAGTAAALGDDEHGTLPALPGEGEGEGEGEGDDEVEDEVEGDDEDEVEGDDEYEDEVEGEGDVEDEVEGDDEDEVEDEVDDDDEGDDETVTLRVWRGDAAGGSLIDYTVPAQEGEVVLDVVHRIQATLAPDLACRWNCKAGKCGSCSAEIEGKPRLMCMTRVDELPPGPITVTPMRTFPILRDLVTDVSFNYEVANRVPAFAPRPPGPEGYRMQQVDVERGQEFRKCIECFLCQDVCHVIRDHEENKAHYAGPRFFIRLAELEMHPLDTNDRRELIRQRMGIGLCNITKCCTEVCPEHIKITDNAIIPLKERVVDASYDPVAWVGRKILRRHKRSPEEAAAERR